MGSVFVSFISIPDAGVEGVGSSACESGFRATKTRLPLEAIKVVVVFMA